MGVHRRSTEQVAVKELRAGDLVGITGDDFRVEVTSVKIIDGAGVKISTPNGEMMRSGDELVWRLDEGYR